MMRPLLRDRYVSLHLSGAQVHRGAARVIVARRVAGSCRQARQHIVKAHVELASRQRVFHQLDARLEIVLIGAREYVGEGEIARHRLLVAKHRRLVGGDARLALGARGGYGDDGAPRKYGSGQCQRHQL